MQPTNSYLAKSECTTFGIKTENKKHVIYNMLIENSFYLS